MDLQISKDFQYGDFRISRRRLTLGRDISYGVYVNMCASWCDLFTLPKCVHLPYLRHLSLMTKINGLLQLITICTFTQLCYFY